MELIKYCKTQFNVLKGCKTLQLGTPAYYRSLDPAQYAIADEQEGFINYMANDEGRKNFNVLDNIGSNPYLFCVSTKDMSMEDAQRRFGYDYDSRFYIKDANQFKSALGDALANQFTLEDLSEISLEDMRNQSPRNLLIKSYMDIVKYKPFNIIPPEEDFDLTSFEVFRRSQFTKGEKYTDDYEYRFMFTIQQPNTGFLLSFSDEPKTLQFPDFMDWSFLSSEKVEASNYFISE